MSGAAKAENLVLQTKSESRETSRSTNHVGSLLEKNKMHTKNNPEASEFQ